MRALPFWVLALSTTMLTVACSPDFDAGEKQNKEAIVSENADLQRKLAMASEAGGDLGAAERIYTKLSQDGSTQTSIELASFYARNDQANKAVSILEAAYSSKPGDVDLMRALANNLISAGKPERALELLDGAIAGGSTNAYVYNSRGVALDTLGQYKQAQQSYNKAITLNPQDEADFKTNLAMSYILSGEYTTAIETLQPMMRTKGSTPQSRQNLALAYGLMGDMDTAMSIGSKDISLKQMKENIRFYQHFSESRGMRTSQKNMPAMPERSAALTPAPMTTAEGELPPPPPPPMRNLTQYPASVQPIVPAAPVAPVAPAAPVAQSPSPAAEKPVAESAPVSVANPNFVDQFAPSPKPLEPVRVLAEPVVTPATTAATMPPAPKKEELVQHKMITTPAAKPKETGIVPASESSDMLKDEENQSKAVQELQPSAGGMKKQAAMPSSSDILNMREAAKFMDEPSDAPHAKVIQNITPAAKAKQDAAMSTSDMLNSREAAKLMDEPSTAQVKEVQKLQPSAGGAKKQIVPPSEEEPEASDTAEPAARPMDNRSIPAPVLKPDSW